MSSNRICADLGIQPQEEKISCERDWFLNQLNSANPLPSEPGQTVQSDTRAYLRVQRALIYSYFSKQLKLQSESTWFKAAEHSKEECYFRAYQEALLLFSQYCFMNKTNFKHHLFYKDEIVNEILQSIIEAESKSIAKESLTDIAHFAKAEQLMMKYPRACSSKPEYATIINHLNEAVKISEFPFALKQLVQYLKLGADLTINKSEQRKLLQYYQTKLANQNIPSAQNDLATFYLTNMIGEDLSEEDRVRLAKPWLIKAIAGGCEEAKKNLPNLQKREEQIDHRRQEIAYLSLRL